MHDFGNTDLSQYYQNHAWITLIYIISWNHSYVKLHGSHEHYYM